MKHKDLRRIGRKVLVGVASLAMAAGLVAPSAVSGIYALKDTQVTCSVRLLDKNQSDSFETVTEGDKMQLEVTVDAKTDKTINSLTTELTDVVGLQSGELNISLSDLQDYGPTDGYTKCMKATKTVDCTVERSSNVSKLTGGVVTVKYDEGAGEQKAYASIVTKPQGIPIEPLRRNVSVTTSLDKEKYDEGDTAEITLKIHNDDADHAASGVAVFTEEQSVSFSEGTSIGSVNGRYYSDIAPNGDLSVKATYKLTQDDIDAHEARKITFKVGQMDKALSKLQYQDLAETEVSLPLNLTDMISGRLSVTSAGTGLGGDYAEGDIVRLSYTLTNEGVSTQDVTVTFTPEGVAAASSDGTADRNSVTFKGIEPKGVVTATATYEIQASDLLEDVSRMTFTASAEGKNETSSDASAFINVAANPKPEDTAVAVTGRADKSEAQSGEEVTFYITLTSGKLFRGNANLKIVLPDGFTVTDNKIPDRSGMVATVEGTSVSYKIPDMQPSSQLQAIVKGTAPADLENDASLNTKATVTFGESQSDEATIPITVKKRLPEALGPITSKITLTRTNGGSTSVDPGETVEFDVTGNFTSEEAERVRELKLILDAGEGATIQSAKLKDVSEKLADVSGQRATLDIGDGVLGKDYTMHVVLRINDDVKSRSILISAYATWINGGSSSSATTTLNVSDGIDHVTQAPSVHLIWSDNGNSSDRTYRKDDKLPVRMTVSNVDTAKDLSNVRVRVEIPDGVTVKGDGAGTASAVSESDKRYLEWSLGTITAKGSKELNFELTGTDAATRAVLSAVLTAGNLPVNTDSVQSNSLVLVREVPDQSALQVVVYQDDTINEITAGAGQKVAYKVVVYNNGSMEMRNVKAEGMVGNGLVLGKTNNTAAVLKDGKFSWNIGTLQPGSSASCSFGVTVPSANMQSSYSFQASATADEVESMSSNVVIMKTGTADIGISLWQKKTGMNESTQSEMTVGYGEDFSYVVTISNSGTAAVSELTAALTVPSSMTINTRFNDSSVKISGNTVNWIIASIKPGETVRKELSVKAPSDISTNNGTSAASDSSARDMRVQLSAKAVWSDAVKSNNITSNTLTTVIHKDAAPVDSTGDTNAKGSAANSNGNANGQAAKKVNNTGLNVVAISATTKNHMMAYADQEIINVQASYSKLTPGTHYTGTIALVNESDGTIKGADGKNCAVAVDFTPSSASGQLDMVSFTINGKEWTGKSVYGAIALTPDGGSQISYDGVGFEESTVHSARITGAAMSNPVIATSGTATATERVSYQNVQPGQAFSVVTVMMDRDTKKPVVKADGKSVMGTNSFKAEKTDGSVDISVEYGPNDVNGKNVAMYVTLYDGNGNVVLAVDQDMNRNTMSGTALATGSGSAGTNGSASPVYATAKTGGEESGVNPAVIVLVLLACSGLAGGLYFFLRRRVLK